MALPARKTIAPGPSLGLISLLMSSTDFDTAFGAAAEALVKKYPQKRSAVMPLLQLIQDSERHVSHAAIEWVASKLDLQPINVYELVTFYPSYKEQPMGRLHLRVCKTLSCMLAGARQTGAELEKALGCKIGETRSDGAVSIEWVECLACCDKAPVVMVGDRLETHVKPDKIPALVSQFINK